jgi:hypothetical protein
MRILGPSSLMAATCAVALTMHGSSVAAAPRPDQQTRAATGTLTAPPTTPAAAAPASSAQYLEETSLTLRRADVDAKMKTLPATAAAPKRSGLAALTDSLKGAVTGDPRREEAARLVVEDLATQASANNTKTVVVIIGSEDDRTKVKASMANVHRRVVLALLDRSVKDDTSDNSAVGAGLSDQLTGSATNVWVFIPRSGQKAHKPDQTLSTRVMTDKIWTGLFAADGDLPVEASNLTNTLTGRPAPATSPAAETRGTSGSEATATPSATTPTTAAAALVVGDVVRPKIAGVKLLAQPSDSAKAVVTLAKTDELVVTGGEKDGFTNVQGASGAGWVKTVMLAK